MKKLLLLLTILAAFLVFNSNLSAQNKVRVKFAKGATSAALKGTINGYKYIDYIVAAKSGQTMTVNLKTSNPASGFYMYYSNMKEVDETSGVTEITRKTDVDDNYIIRVIMPRSSARRKESASFTLNVSIE